MALEEKIREVKPTLFWPLYPPNVWFPLTDLWDVQNLPPPGRFTFPLTIKAGEKLLMWTDEDLNSPKGWVYAASLATNKPKVGVRLEYESPRGRRVIWEQTVEDLYSQGLLHPCPGAWIVTRWGAAEPPEYVAILFPSFLVPYQPQGSFYLFSKETEDATVYSLLVTLINLFEPLRLK